MFESLLKVICLLRQWMVVRICKYQCHLMGVYEDQKLLFLMRAVCWSLCLDCMDEFRLNFRNFTVFCDQIVIQLCSRMAITVGTGPHIVCSGFGLMLSAHVTNADVNGLNGEFFVSSHVIHIFYWCPQSSWKWTISLGLHSSDAISFH